VTTVAARAHRRAWNLEGAFPLFFLGAALAVGGVVLALETPTPRIDRVEIWQFLVALGAVIVAAGVFSIFFAEEDSSPPVPSGIPVGATAPAWVEAPASPEAPPPVPATIPPTVAMGGAPSSTSRVAVAPAGPEAGAPDEIDAIMSQLDELTKEIFSAPRSPAAPNPTPPAPAPASAERAPERPAAPGCADCGRVLAVGGPRLPCEVCGRPLCEDCALDAASHRGAVACRNCREEAGARRPPS
jgi:hypothetical protein